MKSWGFDLVNYTDGGDGCTFANQTSFKEGHGSKNVVGYDSDYNCVYEFESSSKAAKHLNLNRGSISAVCSKNNRTKTTKGLTWFYKEDIELLSDKDIEILIDNRFTKKWKANSGSYTKGQPSSRNKRVCMFNLDWILIHTFGSAKEAGEFVNVTGGAIQYACLKSKKSICKKYKWKYEEDVNFRSHEIGKGYNGRNTE